MLKFQGDLKRQEICLLHHQGGYRAKKYQEECVIFSWVLPLHYQCQRKSWDPVLIALDYAPFLTQCHSCGDVQHRLLSNLLPTLSLNLLKCAGCETHLTGCCLSSQRIIKSTSACCSSADSNMKSEFWAEVQMSPSLPVWKKMGPTKMEPAQGGWFKAALGA